MSILMLALWLAAPATCEGLASLKLPDATITLAQSVPAGTFTLPATVATRTVSLSNLPAFCRVAATLKPTNDSDIKIEVWLPQSGWNGKFQAVGNGGWAGVITYTSGTGGIENGMAEALKRGYATSSTDTGHAGNTASGLLGHPEKVTDYDYRAVHEMTLTAKKVIAGFYGRGPDLSYFNGCSTGGRQALKEAQTFYEDYDGIIAGAPAADVAHMAAGRLWVAHATLKDPASYIPPSKYPMIHEAVMKSCDAADGLKDGLIDDPRQCHFDPSALVCTDPNGSCLTGPQAAAAQKIMSPVVNPRTGKQIFPRLEPGTELEWGRQASGPEPYYTSLERLRYVIFKDPKWDWRSFDFDRDVTRIESIDKGNATDPNLKSFVSRGGKLLMYHGWADQSIAPTATIKYYDSVVSAMGGPQSTANWLRLFMLPGMNHCGGGEGPNAFDAIGTLEQWVEKGKAPDQILASHRTNGKVDRTRPLCPYPQVAKFKGSGSVDDATNFTCKAP